MKIIEVDHPFFRPLWRRVAVVAVCALWAALEWATQSPLWAMGAGALAAYTFYVLILTFDPDKADKD